MNIRMQVSRATVNALQRRLQEAYRRDDARLVRRINALLGHLVNGVPVAVLSEQWGVTPACFYQWLMAFPLQGLDSLGYQSGGGRRAKLTPRRRSAAEAASGASACYWSDNASPERRSRERREGRRGLGGPGGGSLAEQRGGLTTRQFVRYHLMRLPLGHDLTHFRCGGMPRRIATVEELAALRPELCASAPGPQSAT